MSPPEKMRPRVAKDLKSLSAFFRRCQSHRSLSRARALIGALSLDLPVLVGNRAQIAFARLDGRAVHRIEIILAGGCVPPQQIALRIAVVVADRDDAPV